MYKWMGVEKDERSPIVRQSAESSMENEEARQKILPGSS